MITKDNVKLLTDFTWRVSGLYRIFSDKALYWYKEAWEDDLNSIPGLSDKEISLFKFYYENFGKWGNNKAGKICKGLEFLNLPCLLKYSNLEDLNDQISRIKVLH